MRIQLVNVEHYEVEALDSMGHVRQNGLGIIAAFAGL